MIWRAVAGFLFALAIASSARAARALSASGAAAATLLGTLAVVAGWRWGALLIAFFATSTFLSRWGAAAKELRTGAIVEKGGERDVTQVLANGGVFVGAALLAVSLGDARWTVIALGALAASASDTWATEVGTLFGGAPRSILSWRRLPPGSSGAVSVPGTLAAVAGAAVIALLAALFGWPRSVALAVGLGGVAGSSIDSLLGAILQGRRWCEQCAASTERMVHVCGTRTIACGGVSWLDNDVVNLLSSAAGGVIAMTVAHV